MALSIAGAGDEAMAASHDLLAAAAITNNPSVASFVLLGYGMAHHDADPVAAYEALRRGLAIAQDSGNRTVESHLAVILSRLAATHTDTTQAFDYLTLAIRNFYDSGSFSLLRSPTGDPRRLLRPARTLRTRRHHQRFRSKPLTRIAFPEVNTAIAHLREVLGDEVYESCARAGENMTNAAMATYAFDQIDQARADLLGMD